MKIYCCFCKVNIDAELVSGAEVYPHRPDLTNIPIWRCETCRNYVGCHHKTKNRTKPLGVIPTPELRKARRRIHDILDPIWKSGDYSRSHVYRLVRSELRQNRFHTAEIRTIQEARRVCRAVALVAKCLAKDQPNP